MREGTTISRMTAHARPGDSCRLGDGNLEEMQSKRFAYRGTRAECACANLARKCRHGASAGMTRTRLVVEELSFDESQDEGRLPCAHVSEEHKLRLEESAVISCHHRRERRLFTPSGQFGVAALEGQGGGPGRARSELVFAALVANNAQERRRVIPSRSLDVQHRGFW